jgi:hypothetical protein
LRFVESQKLEISTFIIFQLEFELNEVGFLFLQWLDACIVLPYETLKFGWSIGQFWWSFRQDFIGGRFVHIIGWGFASSFELISLYKATRQWVILFKFEISRGFIITECTSYGQIFRSCVKNYSCWLWDWRAHMNCSHVNCVISTIEWYLESKIVLFIFSWISNFRNQLFLVNFGSGLGFRFKISHNISLDLTFGINIQIFCFL